MEFDPRDYDYQMLQAWRDRWESEKYEVPFNDFVEWIMDIRTFKPRKR